MSRITASTTIPARPEAVWSVFADPASYEKWFTIHTKWKDRPDAFSEGAKASEVVTMLGMPNTIEWTVQEYTEPTRLTISGTGMAGVRTTFALSVVSDGNGGSTATIDAEFTGQMITGALGKAVEKDAQNNLDESLANVATLVT